MRKHLEVFSNEKRWVLKVLSGEVPAFDSTLNFNELVAMSERNGLGAILFQRIKDAYRECPPALKTALKRSYLSNLLRNTNICNVWSELKGLMNTEGYQYIPLKGIYLAQYVYSDTTLRAMSDIDVMLSPQDADNLYLKLLAMGAVSSDINYKPFKPTTDHHLPGLSYKGIYIELHRELFPTDSDYYIPSDLIWKNLVTEGSIQCIHPHINLVYLCLHLYYTVRRGGMRISWLYDFIVYSQSKAFINCEENFMDRVNKMNCVEPVLGLLYVAEKLFNYRFPFIEHGRSDKEIQSLQKRVFYFINNQSEGGTNYSYEIALERLKNTSGLSDKITFLKKMVIKPDSSFGEIAKRIYFLSYRTVGMLGQKLVSFFRF